MFTSISKVVKIDVVNCTIKVQSGFSGFIRTRKSRLDTVQHAILLADVMEDQGFVVELTYHN